MDGRAVYISPGRYVCFGHFKRDKGHGSVTMIYSKGNKYEHTCFNGVKNGREILTYSDGNIEVRIFDHGTWTRTVLEQDERDILTRKDLDKISYYD